MPAVSWGAEGGREKKISHPPSKQSGGAEDETGDARSDEMNSKWPMQLCRREI